MAAEHERLERLFRPAVRGRLLPRELLRAHTSFRVGGPADLLFFPADPDDLRSGLRLARAHGLPAFVMGRGTNLLVRDGGIRGLVINLGDLNRIEGGEIPHQAAPGTPVSLSSLGGTPLSRVINFAVRPGLSGLEWGAGIPGSVGGAIAMNAGAQGPARATCRLDSSKPRDEERVPSDGRFRTAALLSAPVFVGRTGTAGRADRRCSRRPALPEEHKRRRSAGRRIGLQEPAGDFAGRLIEAAGLKGERVGGAEVSVKHANVIVNIGQATAADIQGLMETITARVQQDFGVRLESEIQIVGEDQ
jgi:UDP-N-acetylmuramate dehydrogenase